MSAWSGPSHLAQPRLNSYIMASGGSGPSRGPRRERVKARIPLLGSNIKGLSDASSVFKHLVCQLVGEYTRYYYKAQRQEQLSKGNVCCISDLCQAVNLVGHMYQPEPLVLATRQLSLVNKKFA